MVDQKRKTIKHFHENDDVHELTFSCYGGHSLLTNDEWRRMLAESIDRAISRHHYQLIAYVFMPNHVHLLVHPEQSSSSIPRLLKAMKRPFSYRIKQVLMERNSSLLDRLTVEQRPGVSAFRFWQEGPGYDRNITEPATLDAAIAYIHENPVKKRLCQRAIDWKWSSARFFNFPEQPQEDDLPVIGKLPLGWRVQKR